MFYGILHSPLLFNTPIRGLEDAPLQIGTPTASEFLPPAQDSQFPRDTPISLFGQLVSLTQVHNRQDFSTQ